MGTAVLRGITTALFVTVLTLLAGILWSTMGLGGVSVSQLVDIGLLVSCLAGGYRTGKESGLWVNGAFTGAGFVIVGALILALFQPIRGLGFLQVLAEGALLGSLGGALGAGRKYRTNHNVFRRSWTPAQRFTRRRSPGNRMDDDLWPRENEESVSSNNQTTADRSFDIDDQSGSDELFSARTSRGDGGLDTVRVSSEEPYSSPWWEEEKRFG